MTDADSAPANAGWILAPTMLASSLASVDGSITNVALPSIGKNLHGDAASMQWVINAYQLPLFALLLIGVPWEIISGVGACSSSGRRAVQGIGAAILMPNSLGILGSAF